MYCCQVCVDLGLVVLRNLGQFIQCFGSTRKELLMLESNLRLAKLPGSDGVSNNIIYNPEFQQGTEGWLGLGCSLAVGSWRGSKYCIAQGRKENWQGLAQDIGKRVQPNEDCELQSWVGISGRTEHCTRVRATVKLEKFSGGIVYIRLGSVEVAKGKWTLLTASFRISDRPKKVNVYFDGPDGGTDILVSSVSMVPHSQVEMKQETGVPPNYLHEPILPKASKATDAHRVGLIQNPGYADYAIYRAIKSSRPRPPTFKDPKYLVNIVDNSNLKNGLSSWYAMGNCRLQIFSGAPRLLGASARKSFMDLNIWPPNLSGNFIRASKRIESFEGPAQDITSKIQLFNNYQVTAWVKTALPPGTRGTLTPQRVNVALDVDGEWVQGGEISAGSTWTEVSGAFRLETQPAQVTVYVQGPDPGIDVMVAGLQIFAVDRLARVPMLQHQTDQIRKRDVVLNVRGSDGKYLPAGTRVSIQQTKNSFPLGSAINPANIQKEGFRNFFLEHFNHAVFENDLKWEYTEPLEDLVRYHDADDLVQFCQSHDIPIRGHCIVWEAETSIQDWLRELEAHELFEAVQDRFTRLLTRYEGVFKHYDVDNEMLHGSYYKDNLGDAMLPYMFKLANQFAPDAQLFVNDYHIDDGYDYVSSPSKYVELIESLQADGAPIGGIGVQGHQEIPVGSIISQSLDQLGALGIPIWYTEIDVSSVNEYVRADDLEVVLREAYAHPSVEGCMLWGFLEGAMNRENAALVNSDMTLNEAGRRLLALKQEWTTNFEGVVDSNGQILFRGFQGAYTVSTPGSYGSGDRYFRVSDGDGSSVTVDVAV